jgi:hypothetical protein
MMPAPKQRQGAARLTESVLVFAKTAPRACKLGITSRKALSAALSNIGSAVLPFPPRLSWAGLERALADQGIRASEQQLIDTPLEIVPSESAAAEVDAGQPRSETAGTD